MALKRKKDQNGKFQRIVVGGVDENFLIQWRKIMLCVNLHGN
jgi:hypothetical protein